MVQVHSAEEKHNLSKRGFVQPTTYHIIQESIDDDTEMMEAHSIRSVDR